MAVRNSWARNVSANEMPTSVRGVPSAGAAAALVSSPSAGAPGVLVMEAASHIATRCL